MRRTWFVWLLWASPASAQVVDPAEPAPAPPAPPTPTPTPTPTPAPDPAPAPPVAPSASEETVGEETLDAQALPGAEPIERGYPRRFVDRPVVLPNGITAFGLGGNGGRETYEDDAVFYARGAIGVDFGRDGFEVSTGVELLAFISDEQGRSLRSPRFQRLHASVTWALPRETYVGVQGVIGYVFSDYQRYSPSLFAGHRFRVSDAVAIDASGDVDYNRGRTDDDSLTHATSGFGRLAVRVQLGDDVAVQAAGSASYTRILDDGAGMSDTATGVGVLGTVLFSATDLVDVTVSFGSGWTDSSDRLWAGLGLTVRTLDRAR